VLVLALAERNRERFAAELARRLEAGEATDWRSFARTCVASYETMARSEPGFATVRFGDVIAMRLNPKNSRRNDEVGLSLMQVLVTQFGFPESPELEFATTVAMESADAMIRRAFQGDPDGDPRFIEAADSLVQHVLTPFAPADD